MNTLNIHISEKIFVIDVICIFNKKQIVSNIYHYFIVQWNNVSSIFSGISSFARPPTVYINILNLKEPLSL